MKDVMQRRFALDRRTVGIVLGTGLGAAVLSAANPAALPVAYRLAFLVVFSPAAGCTILLALHRSTGGQWSRGIAPILRAGGRMTPWVWLLALPMLFMPIRPYGGAIDAYDGAPFVAVRTIIYAVIFFLIRSANEDGEGDEVDARRNHRPWAGPVSLIVLFFTLTLVANDWIESLEPGWHSTAFGAVWIVGQTVSALALCLLFALGRGAKPSEDGPAGRQLGLDWGDLLLSAIVFGAYITFAQFLIIWSGNLPREISWYLRRESGGWGFVMPVVALAGFAVPFAILLSRRQKVAKAGIALSSALVLAAQVLYMVWLIAPAQPSHTVVAWLLEAVLVVFSVLVFIWRFAACAREVSR